MKILVIDKLTGSTDYITTVCKPSIGDNIPLRYMNQKVTVVIYPTVLTKELLSNIDTNTDLIVYTE